MHEQQKKGRQIGLYQNLKLCTPKDIVQKVKRQPTEWEKGFANHLCDKCLLSIIHKELQLCRIGAHLNPTHQQKDNPI